MRATVLILFAEAMAAPEVAWSLVDSGHEVIAIARRGRRAAVRHSSHVNIWEVTPPEFDARAAVTELTERCRNFELPDGQPAVILPLDDAAIWLCNEVALPSGWMIAGARGSTATLALDKSVQTQAAKRAGLPVPATTIARTSDEVVERAAEFPLILRPADAVAVRGNRLSRGQTWICSNRTELNRALAEWESKQPLIVQPFIEGDGEGVFGLATDHGIDAWSSHKRIRMMNPHGSGSSACESQAVRPEIQAAIERLIEGTNWRGLFMIELLRDRAGKSWFVELNGRPWGSMALSRRQGFEYPAWSVMAMLQPPTRSSMFRNQKGSLSCAGTSGEKAHAPPLRSARAPNPPPFDNGHPSGPR